MTTALRTLTCNQNSMDKFLLAYNPNTDAKSGLFIVHCLHPMAIIEVSKSPPEADRQFLKVNTPHAITNFPDEVWYLCPTGITEVKVLARAAHWFKAHRLNAQVGLSK